MMNHRIFDPSKPRLDSFAIRGNPLEIYILIWDGDTLLRIERDNDPSELVGFDKDEGLRYKGPVFRTLTETVGSSMLTQDEHICVI